MRWRLYAGISTVFVLGGVAGGILGISAERERLRNLQKDGPALVLDGLTKRLEEELKLDPSQVRRVREIYASTRPQLQLMERDRRRRLRQLMEGTHSPILEILTPAQKERYQQIQQKLQLRLRLRDNGNGNGNEKGNGKDNGKAKPDETEKNLGFSESNPDNRTSSHDHKSGSLITAAPATAAVP